MPIQMPKTGQGNSVGSGMLTVGTGATEPMSQSTDTMERYEYVPMNIPYSKIGIGYGFGEGVGINASGALRGYVVIHEYSSGIFPEGAVPGKTQQATIPISVRKVTTP